MRTRLWMKVVGACLAVLVLGAAFYFFSLGVLFESGCHLGDQGACENEARTLRVSFVLALVFVVIGVAIGATALGNAARRRLRTRSR